MNVIGICGVARSGKDTFSNIAKDILIKNGYKVKQYSFAGALKNEVGPFLNKMCGIDVWTNDSEIKADIRDFLVWYGTTFWRKRDPNRWIRNVDMNLKSDGNKVDIALVSDVRYPNEGEWVHSWNGYLVHISSYKLDFNLSPVNDGRTHTKYYITAPNFQETTNDPLVKNQSDYKLEWPFKNLDGTNIVDDIELKGLVLKTLNSCTYFTETLSL